MDPESYRRNGAESNLVNFDRPILIAASESRIETTERRLGVKFHYEFTREGVELVPSEGTDANGALVGHAPAHPQ